MMVMNMINKINFKALAGAVVCGGVAYMTATGAILNYINFAGPENEMGFFLLANFMMLMCLMGIKK